jgi:hypothetical protein
MTLRKFDAFRATRSMTNVPRMSTSLRLVRSFVRSSMTAAAILFAASCGSSPPSGPVGGFVSGPADDHCSMNDAMTMQSVGVCVADTGGDDAAAPTGDGGDDGGAAVPEPYGDPLDNNDGFDDDCKYHVTVESTPIRLNADVTFTVTVVGLDPATPATGAKPYEEITLNDAHVSPSNPTAVETPPGSGIYKIGPIKFDRAGQWIVRFHLFGTCSDTPEDSPHAHIAFKINVP